MNGYLMNRNQINHMVLSISVQTLLPFRFLDEYQSRIKFHFPFDQSNGTKINVTFFREPTFIELKIEYLISVRVYAGNTQKISANGTSYERKRYENSIE